MKRQNITRYTPDARYMHTTHYVVTNERGTIVSTTGMSKRDALHVCGIYESAERKPHRVYRRTGSTGKITQVY